MTADDQSSTDTLDPVIDTVRLRRALSHFCSGIVVVTGMRESAPVGFTCQSFSSLSLDPPLVLFTPQRTSSSWPLIEQSGRFAINVLEAGQEEVSNTFAVSGGDKFDGVDWQLGEHGSPLLAGALATVECSLYGLHDGGDHLIVLGRVLGLTEHLGPAAPLLYFRSRYRTLA